MRTAAFLLAFLAIGTPAAAQIATQRPARPPGHDRHHFQDKPAEAVTSDAVIEPPSVPNHRTVGPAGSIARSPDGQSWITSVDGRKSGQEFAAERSFTIRGHGLSTAYTGSIMGSRDDVKPGRKSTRHQSTGSILKIKVISDDEVLATVSRIRAGEFPWASSTNFTDNAIALVLKLSRGQQEIRVPLGGARYTCRSGEINCV